MPYDQTLKTLKSLCLQNKFTLATAESITAGGLGYALTEISGASQFYKGGYITYASELKKSLLDIPQSVFDSHGVYSHEMVCAMATNTRKKLNVDYAIALSGVAETGIGDEGHVPGTIFCAIASPNNVFAVQFDGTSGNRDSIRQYAIKSAIDFATTQIKNELYEYPDI